MQRTVNLDRDGRFRGNRLLRALAPLGVVALVGCGGPPPPPETPDEPDEGPAAPTAAPKALSIESELGAMDRSAVKEAFAEATNAMLACVDKGRRGQTPLLGGAVTPFLRVDKEGRVRWAYLQSSTLGDLPTERCILDLLASRSWPAPQGGKEGETSQELELGEPDERPPVAWSESDLGHGLGRLKAALRQCANREGTGPLSVTFYVDPSTDGRQGKATAVGVAVSDDKGMRAADCAVKAVRASRYPSPGSYTAKVTVGTN